MIASDCYHNHTRVAGRLVSDACETTRIQNARFTHIDCDLIVSLEQNQMRSIMEVMGRGSRLDCLPFPLGCGREVQH